MCCFQCFITACKTVSAISFQKEKLKKFFKFSKYKRIASLYYDHVTFKASNNSTPLKLLKARSETNKKQSKGWFEG